MGGMGDAVRTIDCRFLGMSRMIAAFAAPTGDGGFVLIETGPASTLGHLERGLRSAGFRLESLRAVFVTHVHLDHSGAAGTLARRAGCPVHVHPEGATHLVDPSRLLASAKRIYGRMLKPLWGTTEPVDEGLVRPVEHGESVRYGDLELRAWHTPGHAIHHVSWQLGDVVATGDVGGVRFPGHSHVVPPMPPPDIVVPRWRESIELLCGLAARQLLVTHFGAHDDPARHLDELQGRIRRWVAIGQEVVAAGGAVGDLARRLAVLEKRERRASGTGMLTELRYRMLGPMGANAVGLYRAMTGSR
jgi:glyoxylase-like metal-dependent hydrolase (beta-lactamase superfamily II)